MPEWKPSYTPKSFIEVVKDNEKIQAHSLILIDPGLKIKEAINQLEISANEFDLKIKKLVICQCLGSKNSKVLYKSFEEAKQLTGVREPYCLIIPGKLHFVEEEFLKNN